MGLINADKLKAEFDLIASKSATGEWFSIPIKHIKQIIDNAPSVEPVIKCQNCKYRIKEWREDKRMKEKGYWVYGCKHFGEIMGYWGFGGNDNEFCSNAQQEGDAE